MRTEGPDGAVAETAAIAAMAGEWETHGDPGGRISPGDPMGLLGINETRNTNFQRGRVDREAKRTNKQELKQ
ncbi:MAG: hypothetical protein KIPDCIKN_04373 [Haliscomenobacter sp.]|nr:hypothetical protein [Haliscomenobacter sp.]